MKTRIQKWGNSLALRIPKSFIEEAGLGYEADVELTLEKNRLVITPIKPADASLRELLEGITAENRHAEIDTGSPAGNEQW